jgi:hypothetical protein
MRVPISLLAGAAILTACDQSTSPTDRTSETTPSFAKQSAPTGQVSPVLARANTRLAASGKRLHGKKFMLASAVYVTTGQGNQAGQTIFANDRVKQLPLDYVPGDPRRGGGINITYLVDQSDGATANGLSSAATEGAIDRALATWEAVRCSKLSIDKVADPGFDPDLVDGIFGIGGIGTPIADITHAGWAPAAFFDFVAPGGSGFILAVTFPFIFVDGAGNPTDINGDGKADTAFNEIYYNNAFAWGINTSTNPFDVETVALHESGHGLSQAHFGKIFITNSNGKAHFAPFAVMNAIISRQAQSLRGSDNGGHCSIWANWPNQ